MSAETKSKAVRINELLGCEAVSVDDDAYIEVKDNWDEHGYLVECTDDDDAFNHLSAMLEGIELYKGIKEAKHSADPWLKVLEDKVKELKGKHDSARASIDEQIANFRKWVAEAADIDIYYEAGYRASEIDATRETYKAIWQRYKKAEAELLNYKETMGL